MPPDLANLVPIVEKYADWYGKAQLYVGSVEEQRKHFGIAHLRAPLPLGMTAQGRPAFNSLFLPPFGDVAYDLALLIKAQARLQSPDVFGLFGASGSGKTKTFYSLADTAVVGAPCSVLTIYNAFGDKRHPALLVLQKELAVFVGDVARGVRGVEERALDLVRLYIASFAVWTLAVQQKVSPANADERRKLWLLCLENGWGQMGVTAAFESLVAWWMNLRDEVVKEYYRQVFDELRAFADECGEPLVVAFDEIGATAGIAPGVWIHLDDYKQHRQNADDVAERRLQEASGEFHECGGGDAQPADLLYALRLLMLGLSDRGILAAFADTDYSLAILRDIGRRSPINGRLKPVKTFSAATDERMRDVLSYYFGIDPPAGALELFCGRPAFFARNLLGGLFATRCGSDSAEWFRRARESALSTSKDDVKRLIIRISRRSHVIYTNFVGSLQCAAVFTPPDGQSSKSYIALDSKEADYFRSTNLVFAAGDASVYDITTEPLVVDVLRALAYEAEPENDLVMRRLTASLPSNKGHLFEDIIAWTLVRRARQCRAGQPSNHPVLLSTVLEPFLHPGFMFPLALSDVTVSINKVINLVGGDPFETAAEDPYGLCCRVSNLAHADIVFGVDIDGKKGVFAVQCKARKDSVPISKCLASVASGCQYLMSGSDEKNYTKAIRDKTTSLSFATTSRAAFEATLKRHSSLEACWIRCVATVKPPNAKLAELVARHNMTATVREAIVLLNSSEAALGTAAHGELLRLCPDGRTHASQQSRLAKLFNDAWTKDVKSWTVDEVNKKVTRRLQSRKMATSEERMERLSISNKGDDDE